MEMLKSACITWLFLELINIIIMLDFIVIFYFSYKQAFLGKLVALAVFPLSTLKFHQNVMRPAV